MEPKPGTRKQHVDFLRGIAMTGVVLANFNGYVEQQIPGDILHQRTSIIDQSLMTFNTVFLEWKFMTLFSILFGYGFGVIMSNQENGGLSRNLFFIRRMFWLFIMGTIHTLFWNLDVLHLYAVSGILLLFFQTVPTPRLLLFAMILMFVPTCVMLLMPPSPTSPDVAMALYQSLIAPDLSTLIKGNVEAYYHMFIASGADLHDVFESLGKFLLGLWLLKSGFLERLSADSKKQLHYIAILAFPVALYWWIRWMLCVDSPWLPAGVPWKPLLKAGVLLNTLLYACIGLQVYLKFRSMPAVQRLVFLGKMTLTNYLLVSVFMITVLYGIGLGLLDQISISQIWLMAVGFVVLALYGSEKWLTMFKYGPAEWTWRQLSWNKRLPLLRQKTID